MRIIDINKIDKDIYKVKINKENITQHTIKISDEAYKKYSKNDITKEQLVKKTFLFLLSKESNTSILKVLLLKMWKSFFLNLVIFLKWVGLILKVRITFKNRYLC